MLSIVRGDNKTCTYYFFNAAGLPYDLDSCVLFFTVKRRQTDDDDDAVISKTLTLSDPTTLGYAILSLVPADTNLLLGRYVYDIQLIDAASKVYTLIVDIFDVIADITRRVEE